MTDEEMEAIAIEIPLRNFAVQASPASWLDYAEELYDSAVALIRTDRDRRIARIDPLRGNVVHSPHSRAYMLLAAFALENILKGIAVSRNPRLVADGKLAPQLKSHGLLWIAKNLAQVELTPDQRTTCGVLESAIPTWGRYPVGLKASTIIRETPNSDDFEQSVDTVFHFLAAELKTLLQEPWNGPHGAQVISGTITLKKDAEPNGPAS